MRARVEARAVIPRTPLQVVMGDHSVIKLDFAHSPRGPEGERYLASGIRVAMRAWDEPAGVVGGERSREYEAVGYVIEGRAELHLEGQVVRLEPGDSYVVPRGSRHHYRILEHFRAIEATSPPAQVHGRDLEVSTPERAERNRDADELPEKAAELGRHLSSLRRHRAHASATYHRLVREAQSTTGLRTKDAAETALLIVLDGICRRLPPTEADHLLAQLSSVARDDLEPLGQTQDKHITLDVLRSSLQAHLHVDPEHATRLVSDVCAVIAEHVSAGQAESTRRSLPSEWKDLFPERPANPPTEQRAST